MAGRKLHLVEFPNVPGADDQPAAVRIRANLFDHLVDLVYRAAARCSPIAPLRSVDSAQIAFSVGPLVPDRDAVFVEIFDISVALEKPKQFIDDRFQMQLLGGEQGEAFGEGKASLGAKYCVGAGPSAVGFEFSLVQNKAEELVILEHSRNGRQPTCGSAHRQHLDKMFTALILSSPKTTAGAGRLAPESFRPEPPLLWELKSVVPV